MDDLLREVHEARRLPPPATAREIRRAAGLTQPQVATELGVHRVTLARWELGTRSPRGPLRLRYAKLLSDLQREVLSW